MVDQEKIHNQCLSDDPKERIHTLEELNNLFSLIPDKQQAWNDLHRLTNDENSEVKSMVASALGSVYSQVPDKQQAWDDLIKLIKDGDRSVRYRAAQSLISAFSQVPDKQQAWNNLIRLTDDKDSDVKSRATYALGSAFSQVPDKQKAWNDLIRLTDDENMSVKSRATYALGSAFSQVPNKQQAWKDLLRLTNENDWWLRSSGAKALGFAFSYMQAKQQAWNNLHRLTNDEVSTVRSSAAEALGSVFSQVPDKQQAWNDLHKLTNDEVSNVRSSAAEALGSSFSQVPDKQQAWNDLLRLAEDENFYVRISSYHSLGRVSIFKTSQAETDEDYKMELQEAIEFFEIVAREAPERMFNPAEFCLPFYRSFHTIIFKKGGKNEIDRYLAEAKGAIRGSKSKELLYEAVENLASALKEVQNLQNIGEVDFKTKKSEINFYRIYCDRAAKLMKDAEGNVPFATVAMRKGLPLLDRNLKAIIEEIQEKAKNTYKQSQGTVTEEIAYSVCREVQEWEMGSPEEMTQKVEDIAYVLKKKIGYIPENEYVLNKIEAMKYERNLIKQYEALLFVIEQIPTMKVISEQELDQKFQKFDRIFDEIIYVKNKLNCISFDVSKIKLNSADVISDLETMKTELEKLSKIEGLNTLSIEKLDSIQAEKINGFNNNILGRLDEIKILIHELSKDNSDIYEEYSRRLDEIKQSKLDTLLQRYSAVISLIGFVISGISIAH